MGTKFNKFKSKIKKNAQKNVQKRHNAKIARKKGEQSAPNSQELINNNGDSDNSDHNETSDKNRYSTLDTLSTTASHVYSHKGKYAIGLGISAISSIACSGLCVLCCIIICFALSLYYYLNKYKSSKKK